MFQPVEPNVNFPKQELAIGEFWKEHRIYEKSLEQRAGAPPFVFYEGPPTANGMPHPGHCLTRAIKDLFPRYRTMRGYRCERKAGWDTHGLPVEVEVCKELGIHSKEEIENYGIEPFIQKCQQSVWRYMHEWERMTERIGFWVDLKNAYATYHQSFVESVWWSLKELYNRGLLYQGHKIVWWWAQGGTALSSGEVGEGYRSVADPSVYVRFPIIDPALALCTVLSAPAAQQKLNEFVSTPHDESVAQQIPMTEWPWKLEKHYRMRFSNAQSFDALYKPQLRRISLVVWTTTPWTLISNQYVAINPELQYVIGARWEGDKYELLIVADDLFENLEDKVGSSLTEICEINGRDLLGTRYAPPFEQFYGSESGLVKGAQHIDEFTACLGKVNDEKVSSTLARTNSHLFSWNPAPVDDFPAFRVVEGGFITTDTGTGLVHIAPAFGEDDYGVLESQRQRFSHNPPKLLCAVESDGKFATAVPDYAGRWVKDCDKDIVRNLKLRGLLLHQEQYVHDYPFCPRAEQDALIQYPRQSWFIRTSQFKDDMLANNGKINWLPEHIKDGRFGKFLETNVDWALSRERYWGTPLPIWKCQATGKMEAVGSYDELMSKTGVRGSEVWDETKQLNPHLPDDLRIHKPYIDEIVYDSPFEKGAHMRRVPEVIDCWYDAGSMPFAQWGYPHTTNSDQHFKSQFPADFISEAIDQTRGWFYAQLAISTLMFGERATRSEDRASSSHFSLLDPRPYPHPFRNCIVLGHMLGEDGLKMSKRKRNYLPPDQIFDRYGADALRWYFFANQPPWTSIRYNEQSIKDSIPEFLLRLWNVYSFFVIYANIDDFDPAHEGASAPDAKSFSAAKSYRPIAKRGELDRWILGELNRTCAAVVERMDAYDNYAACGHITAFVDALSNWYVRRSRDRFWAADKRGQEKLDAYWTLYEALVTTTKLVAPFVPFLAETLWQNVSGVFKIRPESVHLCDFPTGDAAAVELLLSNQMAVVREIVSLGRNARMTANLKVRQPIAKVEVVLTDDTHEAWLNEHAGLIKEELNVKDVVITGVIPPHVHYTVLPNLKQLGPRLGKRLPRFKEWLANEGEFAGNLLNELEHHGTLPVQISDGLGPVHVTKDDFIVRLEAESGWAAAKGLSAVVILDTELTNDLLVEGLARELIRAIQDRRKDIGCEYTDRIEVGLAIESADIRRAIDSFREEIMKETLATKLVFEPLPGVEALEAKLGDATIKIFVRVVK